MRIGPQTFAAVVLLVTLALGRASALEPLHGTWSIELGRSGGSRQLDLQLTSGDGHAHDSSSFDIRPSELGIESALATPSSANLSFTIAREAGSLAASGTADRGTAGGTFVLTPSEAFRSRLRDRGYAALDGPQLFSAFAVDLTTEFLDRVNAAGYAHLPFEHAIAFRALGIDGTYIDQLKATFPNQEIDPGLMTSLRALGIMRDDIAQLRAEGVTIATPEDAVRLRALGIDGAYIKRVAAHGFKHLPIEKLIQLKVMGVVSARFRGTQA